VLIGERIKKARIEKGLSQEELGNMIGVSKVSVCGYEKGTRTPTLENLLQLLEILDVTPDYVLGREHQVVAENESDYSMYMAKEDIEIIKEMKNYRELYNKLCSDPKRNVALIARKINL
jgi:transcriptional regulator with XRE-family HTH domain